MPTYLRKRNRLKDYDYDQAGYYFVTFCTRDRQHYFGQVKDSQVSKSLYGEIADHFWRDIPSHYANVEIDEFMVMPNHIHGIIIIHPAANAVQSPVAITSPMYGLLSKVVRAYKEAVTKRIHNQFQDNEFGWQRSFYDHIIRNDIELQYIQTYISQNPLKWELDRDNPENLYI